MTNECQTMQEQAYQMKEAWKNMSPAEHSHQKHARTRTTKAKRTVIITEARSNVGNISKPGGKWVSGQTPFKHPRDFLNFAYVL
jgi:hypothetical protein